MTSRRTRSEEGGRVESIRDFVQRTIQIGGSTRKSRIGREREIGNEESNVTDSLKERIQEFHDYRIEYKKYGIGLILLYVLILYRYIWMYKKVWIALPYLGYIWYSRLKSIKCVQQCLNGTAQTHVQLYHRILMTQLSNILTNMDGQ